VQDPSLDMQNNKLLKILFFAIEMAVSNALGMNYRYETLEVNLGS